MTRHADHIRSPASPVALAVLLALVALFVAIALCFAWVQDLWTDETTQLAGSALAPWRMIRWLAGNPEALGVPPDRMPPVSYLIDGACLRTVCTTPFHLRIVHLLIVAAALALLLQVALRHYGLRAMGLAGLFLALDASSVNEAVELRAYPLFFAATVLQVWLFTRLFEAERIEPRLLSLFVAASVLAIYTHFFGLVASCAFFVGLALGRVRSVPAAWAVGAALAVVLVAAVGIGPFVVGANALSSAPVPEGSVGIGPIMRYLGRLLIFPSMLIHPVAAALFFVGLLVLLAVFVFRTMPRTRDGWRGMWPVERALAATLVTGLAVTIAAAFVVHGFDPLKSAYSLWTLPVIALLLAASVATSGQAGVRIASIAGAALLVAGALVSQLVFVAHLRWFSHGNAQAIAGAFVVPPGRVAVVLAGGNWPNAYYPLAYRFGPALHQWVLDDQEVLHAIQPGGGVGPPVTARQVLAGADQLLLASVRPITYVDLREVARGRALPVIANLPAWPRDLPGPGWGYKSSVNSTGMYWMRLTTFQRSSN